MGQNIFVVLAAKGFPPVVFIGVKMLPLAW
jgi:hypothetical protein